MAEWFASSLTSPARNLKARLARVAIDIAADAMMFVHTMSPRLYGSLFDLLARVKQLALAWVLGAAVTLSMGIDVPSWRGFQKAGLIWLWGLLFPLLVGVACIGLFMAAAVTYRFLSDLKQRHDADLGIPSRGETSASSTVCMAVLIFGGSAACILLSRFLADGALRLLFLVL